MPLDLSILMPLRDDWASAAVLIRNIDRALEAEDCRVTIHIVDDCSVTPCKPEDFQAEFTAVDTIRVLRLRRNLGHQRAIAVGLAHLQATVVCDAVLVMDSDGEDTPEGVAQLVQSFIQSGGHKAIFAERIRRSESLVFKTFYHLYRFVHRALTGIAVRVGNFSILPFSYLTTLVAMSEMWNHYAAAVFRSRLPYTMSPIPRGKRIAGTSGMNFASLVTHGLSAISVFGDIVGVRLLIGSLAGSLLAALGILAVVAIRFFTDRAIPGWATYAAGTLAVIMIQLIMTATSFTFFVLSSRDNLGFVPVRDYALFLDKSKDIFTRARLRVSRV